MTMSLMSSSSSWSTPSGLHQDPQDKPSHWFHPTTTPATVRRRIRVPWHHRHHSHQRTVLAPRPPLLQKSQSLTTILTPTATVAPKDPLSDCTNGILPTAPPPPPPPLRFTQSLPFHSLPTRPSQPQKDRNDDEERERLQLVAKLTSLCSSRSLEGRNSGEERPERHSCLEDQGQGALTTTTTRQAHDASETDIFLPIGQDDKFLVSGTTRKTSYETEQQPQHKGPPPHHHHQEHSNPHTVASLPSPSIQVVQAAAATTIMSIDVQQEDEEVAPPPPLERKYSLLQRWFGKPQPQQAQQQPQGPAPGGLVMVVSPPPPLLPEHELSLPHQHPTFAPVKASAMGLPPVVVGGSHAGPQPPHHSPAAGDGPAVPPSTRTSPMLQRPETHTATFHPKKQHGEWRVVSQTPPPAPVQESMVAAAAVGGTVLETPPRSTSQDSNGRHKTSPPPPPQQQQHHSAPPLRGMGAMRRPCRVPSLRNLWSNSTSSTTTMSPSATTRESLKKSLELPPEQHPHCNDHKENHNKKEKLDHENGLVTPPPLPPPPLLKRRPSLLKRLFQLGGGSSRTLVAVPTGDHHQGGPSLSRYPSTTTTTTQGGGRARSTKPLPRQEHEDDDQDSSSETSIDDEEEEDWSPWFRPVPSVTPSSSLSVSHSHNNSSSNQTFSTTTTAMRRPATPDRWSPSPTVEQMMMITTHTHTNNLMAPPKLPQRCHESTAPTTTPRTPSTAASGDPDTRKKEEEDSPSRIPSSFAPCSSPQLRTRTTDQDVVVPPMCCGGGGGTFAASPTSPIRHPGLGSSGHGGGVLAPRATRPSITTAHLQRPTLFSPLPTSTASSSNNNRDPWFFQRYGPSPTAFAIPAPPILQEKQGADPKSHRIATRTQLLVSSKQASFCWAQGKSKRQPLEERMTRPWHVDQQKNYSVLPSSHLKKQSDYDTEDDEEDEELTGLLGRQPLPFREASCTSGQLVQPKGILKTSSSCKSKTLAPRTNTPSTSSICSQSPSPTIMEEMTLCSNQPDGSNHQEEQEEEDDGNHSSFRDLLPLESLLLETPRPRVTFDGGVQIREYERLLLVEDDHGKEGRRSPCLVPLALGWRYCPAPARMDLEEYERLRQPVRCKERRDLYLNARQRQSLLWRYCGRSGPPPPIRSEPPKLKKQQQQHHTAATNHSTSKSRTRSRKKHGLQSSPQHKRHRSHQDQDPAKSLCNDSHSQSHAMGPSPRVVLWHTNLGGANPSSTKIISGGGGGEWHQPDVSDTSQPVATRPPALAAAAPWDWPEERRGSTRSTTARAPSESVPVPVVDRTTTTSMMSGSRTPYHQPCYPLYRNSPISLPPPHASYSSVFAPQQHPQQQEHSMDRMTGLFPESRETSFHESS